MRFPSLTEMRQATLGTIERFPLTLVAAVATTVMLWLAIDEVEWLEMGHVFAVVLGIPLSIAIALFAERRGSRSLYLILSAVMIALLVVYMIVAVAAPEDARDEIYRFGLFMLAAHFGVSFAGFLGGGSLLGFWEFNKTLFLRALQALLFSGVLFGGLAVAMLAIDQLLLRGETIKPEAYLKLFVTIGSIFTTLFTLAGTPHIAEAEERAERPYPKGLQLFAQNLLLPLVVLYLAILYVYAGKILITWEWPQGWIGWLVLSFSVVGILALLLLYPLARQGSQAWIARFTRWFYVVVLPLIGLLFAAIMRRLTEYGITENRYFVVLLACWLAGIALYFLLSRKKDIRIIPISLCAAAILSSLGPWSAFAVSTRSQLGRFERMMERNDMVADGEVDRDKGMTALERDREEMRSIIYYFNERGELDELEQWTGGTEITQTNLWSDVDTTERMFGLDRGVTGTLDGKETPEEIGREGIQSFYIHTEPMIASMRGVEIGDYDLLLTPVHFAYHDSTMGEEGLILHTWRRGGARYVARFLGKSGELRVERDGTPVSRFDVRAAVTEDVVVGRSDIRMKEPMPPSSELLTVAGRGESKGLLLISDMEGEYEYDPKVKGPDRASIVIRRLSATMLIDLPEGEATAAPVDSAR